MYCILAHSHTDHSYCNGAPVQAPIQQCTVIWWLIMQLFFSPVQENLFANIESGPHETLSTNLDTSAPFANFLEYVCTEIQMCHVILITVCHSFRTLSIASSQHSTNRTHCVLFYLWYLYYMKHWYVSIHILSSSGNMYQTVLHETEVAILYTYEHNMCGVKESSVQHLWNICAHKWNGRCPRDTVDQDPISLMYTTVLQRIFCVLLVDCFTSCIGC